MSCHSAPINTSKYHSIGHTVMWVRYGHISPIKTVRNGVTNPRFTVEVEINIMWVSYGHNSHKMTVLDAVTDPRLEAEVGWGSSYSL